MKDHITTALKQRLVMLVLSQNAAGLCASSVVLEKEGAKLGPSARTPKNGDFRDGIWGTNSAQACLYPQLIVLHEGFQMMYQPQVHRYQSLRSSPFLLWLAGPVT